MVGGVNITGAAVIVHAGRPYGFINYVQQTGRAGRQEGPQATCVWLDEQVKYGDIPHD